MSWVAAIVNALSCSDLYKYVLNRMHCKSDCCHHNLMCDCDTDAVEIQEQDTDNDIHIENQCCMRGYEEDSENDENEIISNA